jgi:phosphohistidine swiveling domain-containing protein
MGSYKDILEIEKQEGLEFLEDLHKILAIISQEEELDSGS